MERDHVSPAFGERSTKRRQKLFVRRIVGPHGKDATRMQMARDLTKSLDSVERSVTRVKQAPWRVIDVEQNGVEFFAGTIGIEGV